MSRRAQENLFGLAILGVFIAAIVASLGYGPRARLVPIPIATIGALLIVAQLVLQNICSEKALGIDLLELVSRRSGGDYRDLDLDTAGRAPRAQGDAPASDGLTPPPSSPPRFKHELAAFGVVVLLVGLFFLIGPLPAMLAFTATYFALSRHYSLSRSLIYAFACTTIVYAVFHLWLRVDMRQGLIDMSFLGLW